MIFLGSFSSTTDGELEILWSTWETENFRSESLELLVEQVEDLVLDEDISFIGSIGDSIVAFLKYKYKWSNYTFQIKKFIFSPQCWNFW